MCDYEQLPTIEVIVYFYEEEKTTRYACGGEKSLSVEHKNTF